MRISLAAGLLLGAAPVSADGPILNSLHNAAIAPLGATLETQSANASAPFSGNRGTGPVKATSPGKSSAPRLTNAGLTKPEAKDAPPAPPASEKEARNLKLIRGVGAGAAIAGVGLFAYAVLAATTGPIGWAAALVFFGGLSAYLAHRRLKGKDDFGPRTSTSSA